MQKPRALRCASGALELHARAGLRAGERVDDRDVVLEERDLPLHRQRGRPVAGRDVPADVELDRLVRRIGGDGSLERVDRLADEGLHLLARAPVVEERERDGAEDEEGGGDRRVLAELGRRDDPRHDHAREQRHHDVGVGRERLQDLPCPLRHDAPPCPKSVEHYDIGRLGGSGKTTFVARSALLVPMRRPRSRR